MINLIFDSPNTSLLESTGALGSTLARCEYAKFFTGRRAYLVVILAKMIEITPLIQIDEQEIEFVFIRSTGPGGQNVNKVSSAVQLRFNSRESPNLPQEVNLRLVRLAGRRLTAAAGLIIM